MPTLDVQRRANLGDGGVDLRDAEYPARDKIVGIVNNATVGLVDHILQCGVVVKLSRQVPKGILVSHSVFAAYGHVAICNLSEWKCIQRIGNVGLLRKIYGTGPSCV